MKTQKNKTIAVVAISCLALALGYFLLSFSPPEDQNARGREAPEAASGFAKKQLVTATKHMVVAANPHAARAGREILRAGGSAIDAAIAVQLVLNIVEPQSSGIGGGAFLLHWSAAEKKLQTFDGRERAPAAAKSDRFLVDGERMGFRKVVRSGLSIGVPGIIAMMELAHKKHGKLPWARLFEPAIKLADEGFEVSPRLHALLGYVSIEHFDAKARTYFFGDDQKPRPVGYLLRNQEFAGTLRQIARGGAAAFYNGELGQKIVSAVQGAHNISGDMTLADLSSYQAKQRTPVCIKYRVKFEICGMGPPSSGALTVGQTLLLAEAAGAGTQMHEVSASALHTIAEAEKLSFADRSRYIADADFVGVPSGLLDPGYIADRAKLIGSKAMGRATPGLPPGYADRTHGDDATIERSGTSHISIVDASGNGVSMTSSIEGAFGSGVWAAGFLLNNELTDFSFHPTDKNGTPIANRVEAGKRPRSSMSPTMIFDDDSGELRAVLGSPGGSRIILYVVKAVVALVDWKMDAQQAATFPNFGARRTQLELEAGGEDGTALGDVGELEADLVARGHAIRHDRLTSGLHIITRAPDGGLTGGADPRREGLALGD
ncbi:MAG: gamma-glutamyltransferase [Hyphomicrobiaceae bacterium]